MKITLVADVYSAQNNGTSITARRLVDSMKARGHEVTVVSDYDGNDDGVKYVVLDKRKFPVLNEYIEKSNGVTFAEPDREKLTEAIKNSDVVHFLLPFKLSKAGLPIARELKVPYTSAFHCQPENITSHVGMMHRDFPNRLIYKKFLNKFYKDVQFIHCPSEFIASQLKANGYKADTRVISNGVIDEFCKKTVEKPAELKDKICILFVGRYSKEKRHDLVIKAVKKSKYADKIQIIFAGNGPLKDKLAKRARKLKNAPIMKLCTKEELSFIENFCDLYVHPSDIEIEAISCIEAFTCGLVPVISDSKKTATKQFALTKENLFKHGNAKSLAERIDFWLDNPQLKAETAEKYAEYSKQFAIEKCMDKMEQMFFDAIDFYKSYYGNESSDEKI
jgi:glycosyltransferase involved in cell wall biosynthesis